MTISFIKYFEKKVEDTIKKYKLINKKDKILVAISGGKDSFTALYLLNKLGYNVEALFIDLKIKDFSDKNLNNIQEFCKKNNIKLNIVDIKKETNHSLVQFCKKINQTNCATCGVLKRYYLNKKSKELNADKIVTGHNLDDEAENILLNIFNNNFLISLGLGISTGIKNDKFFAQRIKPLYFCTNEETRKYAKLNKLPFLSTICPLRIDAFRKEVRDFIKSLEKFEPKLKINLVNYFNKELINLKIKHLKKQEIKKCKSCGEPTRTNICKKCELINLIK